MTKKDKFIAGFLIFQGLLGLATIIWLRAQGSLHTGVLSIFLCTGFAAIAAGIGSFYRKRWAVILGIIIFAIQVPSIYTQYFYYSFWLGIHFDLAFTMKGYLKLGVNVVALIMVVWSVRQYRVLKANQVLMTADGDS